MSSVVVVTPIITPLVIGAWPVVTAVVTAAVGSLGFSIASSVASANAPVTATAVAKTRAEIEVEDSEILANASGAGEELVIVRDDVRIIFTRDARGAFKLCVEGERHSKADLRRIGEEVLGRVTQQYVYHRVVTELAERNMTVVDEHVNADQSVRIRVRNI